MAPPTSVCTLCGPLSHDYVSSYAQSNAPATCQALCQLLQQLPFNPLHVSASPLGQRLLRAALKHEEGRRGLDSELLSAEIHSADGAVAAELYKTYRWELFSHPLKLWLESLASAAKCECHL